MDIVDRFPLYPLILAFLVYPIAAWVVMRLAPARIRMATFAVLNVAGLAAMCWLSGGKGVRLALVGPYSRVSLFFFTLYFGFALANYAVLRLCGRNRVPWMAGFLLPIVFLIYIKYASQSLDPFEALLAPAGLTRFEGFFIGISYLSFRLVLLAQEVRNEIVTMPSVWEYLGFTFFVPTLSIGPINPYSKFIASFRQPDRKATPIARSLLRILIGFTKYIFLSTLAAQLTFSGLLRDGHPHTSIDLIISVLVFPLYLYSNFSGFCDMVIGVSGLLGIQVAENFDQPFLSRNFQEFWTRWHITLSLWIRDLVFTPLSKAIIRHFGPKSANHAIAFSIFVAFILVGLWHGKGMNFLVFGILQGIGLATVHYYTVFLKQILGRNGFAAYRQNRFIRWTGVTMTYCYFATTLIFFANTWPQIGTLLHSLR